MMIRMVGGWVFLLVPAHPLRYSTNISLLSLKMAAIMTCIVFYILPKHLPEYSRILQISFLPQRIETGTEQISTQKEDSDWTQTVHVLSRKWRTLESRLPLTKVPAWLAWSLTMYRCLSVQYSIEQCICNTQAHIQYLNIHSWSVLPLLQIWAEPPKSLGIFGARFYTPDALPIIQITVSKHWRNIRALTSASSFFSSTNWQKGRHTIYAVLLPPLAKVWKTEKKNKGNWLTHNRLQNGD